MDQIAVRLHRERPIDPRFLRDLYHHADWWPERIAEDIGRMLEASPAVGAWDGQRLVGFARAVTDGVFRAYIEDVVVHQAYRNQGIGTALMARLLDELRGIHVISLFCKSGLVPFYEEQGFQPTTQVVLHRRRQA